MMRPTSSGSLPRWFLAFFLLIIVASFAARNLPWHLDNYDQAKQAFTSHEMVHSGDWWFQHTPAGKVATKPPLAGWISTLLYYLTGRQWWEGAWRIPSFLSALLIVLILWKEGGALLKDSVGSVLAAGAFALNVFTPRLATLVRTDMLLALFIFVVGTLLLRKLRAPAPWSFAEKTFLFLGLVGGVFTKGPIIYAFLLPGLIAYSLFARKWNLERRVWGSIWCWLVPLLAFGSWIGVGIMNSPQFYEEVVLKEFLGRFDVSDAPVHKHQPFYFYVGHLLLRFAPWSLLLITFFGRREVREAARIDPQMLWLLCWSAGGLLLMSAVPSKRFDRIFPVVPPLCLLLVVAAAHLPEGCWRGHRLRTLVFASVGVAICISVGYICYSVQRGFHEKQRLLVHFGAAVKRSIGPATDRLAVVSGKDEGMLLYLNQNRFTGIDGAVEKWRAGAIDWLVIPEPLLAKHAKRFGRFERRLTAQKAIGKNSAYVLIHRHPP